MKSQKNILLLSVLTIFAIGFFAVPDVFADKTYTNQKYYFSLQYPDNWKVSELHLVDKASNSEIIVELTSPEYDANGCFVESGGCGLFWYGEDRILISRDLLPNNPAWNVKPNGDPTSLKAAGDVLFGGISSACKQSTFQNSGQMCKNPILMDVVIFDWYFQAKNGGSFGTDSKIHPVAIYARSTNLYEGGLEYIPSYISTGWYDPVDEHNWQIIEFKSDFKNAAHTSGLSLITTSLMFDRPSDYSPPEATGGCLIATAAFGSEMAPQVQFLREIRDNTVLQTESGSAFMTGFNQFYYSFSPAVADYERENPAFKEAVKIPLIPLLASLTLLQYADIDSESEMLGYGIGVILLNIGMYFVAPAVLIMKVRKVIHNHA